MPCVIFAGLAVTDEWRRFATLCDNEIGAQVLQFGHSRLRAFTNFHVATIGRNDPR
jgi:hypothetical protein